MDIIYILAGIIIGIVVGLAVMGVVATLVINAADEEERHELYFRCGR